ncbi:MAG: hypothetical protein L3K18_00290 [Thermoplasmata archaeon]|nr:hypothetical protein [Thermoplasmata archaeon]MCI4355570.1 hypothetical protein [Thermoplasmata archaeon]
MKTFKQSYPRRGKLLRTPFVPLSDDEFRRLVTNGSAIPSQQGAVLFVSKWRDGPGMAPDAFLAALRAQGSTMVARTYGSDVNIRVVKHESAESAGPRSRSKATQRASN